MAAAAQPTNLFSAWPAAKPWPVGCKQVHDAPGSIGSFLRTQAARLLELRRAFVVFDRDNNGTIDAIDLSASVQMAGAQSTDGEIRRMLRSAQEMGAADFRHPVASAATDSNSKRVRRAATSFDGFAALMCSKAEMAEDEKAVAEVFRLCDRSGTGALSLDEFRAMAQALRTEGMPPLEPVVLDGLIAAVEFDEDGEIPYQEVIRVLLGREPVL